MEKVVFEDFTKIDNYIRKAAERAEAESHICERAIKDILDEVGDCLHDDVRFRRRILNKIFLKPGMREKIVLKFISVITQGEI